MNTNHVVKLKASSSGTEKEKKRILIAICGAP